MLNYDVNVLTVNNVQACNITDPTDDKVRLVHMAVETSGSWSKFSGCATGTGLGVYKIMDSALRWGDDLHCMKFTHGLMK